MPAVSCNFLLALEGLARAPPMHGLDTGRARGPPPRTPRPAGAEPGRSGARARRGRGSTPEPGRDRGGARGAGGRAPRGRAAPGPAVAAGARERRPAREAVILQVLHGTPA